MTETPTQIYIPRRNDNNNWGNIGLYATKPPKDDDEYIEYIRADLCQQRGVPKDIRKTLHHALRWYAGEWEDTDVENAQTWLDSQSQEDAQHGR